ncbi:hypothetical protein GCM10025786_23180 [Nocardioides caeni]
MSLTDDQPSWSSEPPSEWGDGPAAHAPGEAPTGGRTPPQDMAAEQSVLGAMLISKDAIADVVESVRGVDYYRPAHEAIHDAILDLYGRGEPADMVTVADELGRRGELQRIGGASYLHTLAANVPIAANAGFYAEIVREKAILRRLVEAGTKIVQISYAGEGEVEGIVNEAQAEIYKVTDGKKSEDYAPLSDIMDAVLDEIEAIENREAGIYGVPTGFADFDELTNGFHKGQMIVVAARPAMGKALALDTPLPTPSGWTTMGDVAVGDLLYDAEGRPTRVVAATEVLVDRPCFEVEFSDGSTIVADAQHQWLTETRAARKSKWAADRQYNRSRTQRIHAAVVTTEEMARSVRIGADQRANHAVLNAGALDGLSGDLPIPAYVLGAWLGDGHSDGARLTSETDEIPMRIEGLGIRCSSRGGMLYSLQLPPREPLLRECDVCGSIFEARHPNVYTCGRMCGVRNKGAHPDRMNCPDCGRPASGESWQCRECYLDHGSFTALLRTTGVLGDKHIPTPYLRASEEDRRALLAGLLDTDGTVSRQTGAVQFTTTSAQLARDVHELVVSLGYRCGVARKPVKGRSEASSMAYNLNFSTVDDVFLLDRKAMLHKEHRPKSTSRVGRRYVVAVRPVASVPVRCVQVDNDDHLYLAGRSMIPTHNSTLALDFCRAAAIHNNLTAAFFSLEMTRAEIVMRLLSAEARIPLNHIRNGKMGTEEWDRLARHVAKVSAAPMFIDDSPNMTMTEIRAKARRLKQKHDLKLMVIDYLQLMSSGKKVESRQLEVSEFSRQIKLLAKELEIPVIALSQLNRGPEQRSDKRPAVSDLRESGCVTAETRLLRADTNAEITIGELMETGATDVPVWALDDRLKLVPRTLTHAFPSGTKAVYEVTLASGRRVQATGNHPFLTYDGWMPLAELEVGSRVGAIRHVPPPLEIMPRDPNEIVLLGHLIGDGSFVKRQPIRYASIDEHNLETVAWAARQLFGITAVRDEYPAARVTTLRLPAPYRLTHGKRNPIAKWLDGMGLFGLRSHEKFVPDWVFSLPKDQLALFLRSLWATDGCVHLGSKRDRGTVFYATTSRRLADDVARLLLRFNVFTRVTTNQKQGYRKGFQVHVSGAENQLRFLADVGVSGGREDAALELTEFLQGVTPRPGADTVPVEVWDDVRTAMVKLPHADVELASIGAERGAVMTRPPGRQRLFNVAAILGDNDLALMATNDVYWDSIKSIEPIGEQPVYDATVLGVHNFVAEGIALHNSIEQDADMVVLLHRDDVYEKESQRPGEADLIVAKHRNGATRDIVVAFQGHYSRFVDMAH